MTETKKRGRPAGSTAKVKEAIANLPTEPAHPETDEEIKTRIAKAFGIMDRVVVGIAAGKYRGAILSGPPGIGKTHGVEGILKSAEIDMGLRFRSITGTMSPIRLYQALWNARGDQDVLFADDCDTIYGEEQSLDILKGALDTKPTRVISWNKESWILDKAGIPDSFEYRGRAIFASNIDFAAEIQRQSKLAKHLNAVVNRCLYIDLGIKSRREILVRIKQVMWDTNFLGENGLSEKTGKVIERWLNENFATVRSLSIRTAVRLGEMISSDPENWTDMAEIVLCRR